MFTHFLVDHELCNGMFTQFLVKHEFMSYVIQPPGKSIRIE